MPIGGDEKKFRPGDKKNIAASTYNSLIDMLTAYRRGKFNTGADVPPNALNPHNTIYIHNQTGEHQHRSFSVLRIDEPIVPPEDNPLHFNKLPNFRGDIPVGPTSPICIVKGPIQSGKIEKAVVSGICMVRVLLNDPSHEWANPVDGVTQYLESSTCGQARILWYGTENESGISGTEGEFLSGDGELPIEFESGFPEASGYFDSGDPPLPENVYLACVNLIGSNVCDTLPESGASGETDRTLDIVTNVCALYTREDTGSIIEEPESGEYSGPKTLYGIRVEKRTITFPPGTVIGEPFCEDNPTECCEPEEFICEDHTPDEDLIIEMREPFTTNTQTFPLTKSNPGGLGTKLGYTIGSPESPDQDTFVQCAEYNSETKEWRLHVFGNPTNILGCNTVGNIEIYKSSYFDQENFEIHFPIDYAHNVNSPPILICNTDTGPPWNLPVNIIKIKKA